MNKSTPSPVCRPAGSIPRINRLRGLRDRPRVRRLERYSMVSVVNVVLGETILAVAFGVLAWSARSANLLATCLATLPSYMLNRAWVWGRSGRSHLVREVLPFWAMAFLGLALSTWIAGHAESLALAVTSTRAAQTVIVMASILATYGGLWIARFFILDTILFAERPPTRSALNGDG